MKHIALTLALCLVATSSLAAGYPTPAKIRCQVVAEYDKAGEPYTEKSWIEFGVENLGTVDASLYNLTDDELTPIKFKKNSMFSSMNDQGGDMRVDAKGNLSLVGDGDGCTFTTLFLYANSQFTRGWVREEGSETTNFFTKQVSCKVSPIDALL
jgi:hypothetical protein